MAGEIAVQFRSDHLIERGRDTVLAAPLYRGGELLAPTEGTCTVYDGTGSVVASDDVTLDGDVATFTVLGSVTTSLSLSEDWRVEWDLTAGERVVAVNVAHLVRHRLRSPVTSRDLERAMSSLSSRTSISDYTPYIDEALLEIEERLIGKGRRPELILSPSALRRPIKHLALAHLFDDLASRLNGDYAALSDRQREMYEDAWSELTFRYDADQDGIPDPGRRSKSGSTWLCA